jgi:hypothetical protein
MLAYLTDLISPDSQWKVRVVELMRVQDDNRLKLMGFPDEWWLQPKWSDL